MTDNERKDYTMLRKKYPRLRWVENHLGGHFTVGNITVFGENAMHWAVNIRTRRGILCFRLPLRCFGRWWPLYCYFSPDGTPNAATKWLWGKPAHNLN
jgi:hypothetical protein